jgi:IS30 family transposase
MSITYHQLSYTDRIGIYHFLKQGYTQRAIARALGVAPSTVSREIKRNCTGPLYFPSTAQRKTRSRCFKQARKLDKLPRLRRFVFAALRKRWSPEQISYFLKKHYRERDWQVATETIYTYLYVLPRGALRKELLSHLRQFRTMRRKRGKGHASHGPIPDLISIHERPAEIADRCVPGHWEGDLIEGVKHQSALGTLVERTTRTTLLVPLKNKDAVSVRQAFTRKMKSLPRQMRLSMTYDRGGEMAQHKLFTKDTRIKVYFADPQSPWQRGTNENTNGLIRQYFPKGTDFNTVLHREIKKVQDLLNGRPRKVLDWKSPSEAINELLR